jgi:hypothetical protein
MEREARRDRSVIALLEVGAAGLLIAAFFLPWYQLDGVDVAGGLATSGITMAVFLPWFLIPLGTVTVVVASLAGLALPGRGVVVVMLVAFGAAGVGVALRLLDLATGDWAYLESPGPGRGMWLFGAACAIGVFLATLDLVRAGSSTFVWRALGQPSTRRVGLLLAWACAVVIAFAVALFPMFPRWWLVAPIVVLVAPLLVRLRNAR